MFARLAERSARVIRFALVVGWGVIIASLFYDPLTSVLTDHASSWSPFRLDRFADAEAPHERFACPRRLASGEVDWVGAPTGQCDARCTTIQGRCLVEQAYPVGARLFWTILLPIVPMFLLVFGHEAWRRVCPLSALMQIPRRLGLQRTRKVIHPKTGRVERKLVLVSPESFLGRNFWYVQGGLLWLGVSLRILFINSDRVALGVFFLSVIALAMLVGYLFGGKTWCNYICPVSAVQKVYTEPRGLLESEAHAGKLRLTQATCRTTTPNGEDQSICVGCKSPCPDVDLERQYWAGLMEPGRRAFYYGYFGLVWGFYGYYAVYAGNAGYYFSGAWTHEEDVMQQLGAAGVFLGGHAFAFPPKWLAAPLTILGAMLLSVAAGRALEAAYGAYRRARGKALRAEELRHRALVICTFLTFNSFYLFGGRPNINLLSTVPHTLLDIFIVTLSAVWLSRTWPRTSEAYERESVAEALRRQLDKLGSLLARVLGGRSVAQLNTDEVFVLAQALPIASSGARLEAYRATLRECLVAGHADSAAGLSVLENLREQMEVSEDEHAEILAELGIEDAQLLGAEEARSVENRLRLDGFREALERVLVTAAERGVPVKKALTDDRVLAEIRDLQRRYAVTAEEQDAAVDELTGRAGKLVERVERGLSELLWLDINTTGLAEATSLPGGVRGALLAVMGRRRARVVERSLHLLSGLGDDPAHQKLAERLRTLAAVEVQVLVHERQRSLQLSPEINRALMAVVDAALEHGEPVPRPDVADVCARALREWGHVERSIALFALACVDGQRGRAAARDAEHTTDPLLAEVAAAVLRGPESAREPEAPPALARLFALLSAKAAHALDFPSLANLARISVAREYAANELMWDAGSKSDHFLAVVRGRADALLAQGERVGSIEEGEFVGELGVILGRTRTLAVRAGEGGASVLEFDASAFKSLLKSDRLAAAGFLTLVSTRLANTLERVAHG
ncbi:MAG: cyclic nucleotide-binding domain-containing protein [Polyangiales bacterium]